MTGTRVLAFLATACALAASALIAFRIDTGETSSEAIHAPAPDVENLATRQPRLAGTESDETHVALPRLWLGSPVAR
jgi:hypothetical protein